MISPFITGLVLDTFKDSLGVNYAWCIVLSLCSFWYFLSIISVFFVFIKKKNKNEEVVSDKFIILDE
jgi:hypothetical protein